MTSLAILEPDSEVIGRRDELIRGLRELVPAGCVVSDEDGRRAFETDALTAYKQMPLAALLPTSTEQVSRVLKYCKANAIKVIARGAGTSLCGGALPSEDSIVLGVSKMNAVLDINYKNRTARVQTGITNIDISNAVSPDKFFYAPDPSSQLACTLAGNLGMNSGGAHCLKLQQSPEG